jgi:signal transduction histidine kinase
VATAATGASDVAVDDGISPAARARGILLGRSPARRIGLRARVTIAFGLGALLLSAILAGTTYALTRSNLIDQRETAVLRQAYFNASNVQNGLPLEESAENPNPAQQLLSSLANPTGSSPIIFEDSVYYPLQPEFGEDALPAALRRSVLIDGDEAIFRYDLDGAPYLAIGLPLPAVQDVEAAYFEIVDLSETEETLNTLGLSLLAASAVTTAAGAALGWWASRRSLRPLSDVSAAAEAIAGGRLDTRLETTLDPDLATLASSFNDMAQALQDRIERDARFASDVSHELRSPLMTMAAAAEVLESQRAELDERSARAVDLVSAEIDRFRQLVEDLLEISRYDAGAVRLDRDEVRLAEFVLQAVGASGYHEVPIELDAELAGVVVTADKRRLARVIANLLDNAAKYGGGATAVSLRQVDDSVQIAVEDAGPGVPAEDRHLIFDRFARGGVAGRRGSGEGVGLGLALVAEHVRLHGGRVWVEDRQDGKEGARFVVELPAGSP